jgi:hypothetical protein
MSKAKPIITVCLSMLTLSALTSTAASAATAGWMVNGTLLTGSKALSTTAAVDEIWRLEAAGITITCSGTNINSTGPEILAPNKGAAKSVTFNGCSANANCSAPISISTLPILAEATLDGTLAVKEIIKPETGSTFTTIQFEGALCALEGVQPIKGKASVLASGHEEHTLQEFHSTVTKGSGELKIGSIAAELNGASLIRLASGESWSFL